MMYVLGIITGVLLCLFMVVAFRRFEAPVERTMRQVESRLKSKGSIIEPESDEIADWINSLKSS